ncbi:hypothetical protein FA10DRAFT_279631 [Acaromyces ingoldii]|uniref:Uncharacterized protein n=1 Tax=Acaromyces ingoldii TaxID=215250 RepID=A0A316YN96_9BASI|nr:hypothetical protein FA10DRAFT_279631 [Acaromyces ingoldii]PWN90516.1 hypothetical protein FA10DRAFT_279631 [Acaromyces ingoldii]
MRSMRPTCLLSLIAAVLLSSHSYQNPSPGNDDYRPEKRIRLFGQDIEPSKPVESTYNGSASSEKTSTQPYGQDSSNILHPYRERIPSQLKAIHYEQGSLAAKYTSSAAPEQSSFMHDARRVPLPQPLKQQRSGKRPYKKKATAVSRPQKLTRVAEALVKENGQLASRENLQLIQLRLDKWLESTPVAPETITAFQRASEGQVEAEE